MSTDSDPRNAADGGSQKSRFRLEAPSPLEIHREQPAQRFLVLAAGGYWPVLSLLPSGRVVAVLRTDDFHLGQRGRLAAVVSDDGGESWSYPFHIDPRGPDDRNPSVGLAGDGTLLCAFYRADCYENGVYQRAPERRAFDVVLSRSIDGGETWSAAEPIESLVGQRRGVFGRIAPTSSGQLLLPCYRYHGDEPPFREAGLLRSDDDGHTWSEAILIAPGYSETSLLPLPDGRILAALRSHDQQRVALCESSDGGASWTTPQPLTDPQEHPSDLLLLADGRVLLAYGRRVAPFGVRAMVSHDLGRSWLTDQKLVMVADSVTRDCGYPSSIQLADGSILTAYYAVESHGFWPGSYGWHHGATTLGPHCAVVKYRPADLP